MAIALEQESKTEPLPQPDPRFINFAITSADQDFFYVQGRFNKNPYNPRVVDTSPVHNAIVDRKTGATTKLEEIKPIHQYPEEWGEFLGIEDPRFARVSENEVTGYTGVYRNGKIRVFSMVKTQYGVTVLGEEGKGACPQADSVACRFDSNIHEISEIPLEEFTKPGLLKTDFNRFPKVQFHPNRPKEVSRAIGTGTYIPELEKRGFRIYHGQEERDGLVRYSLFLTHFEDGKWRWGEKPFMTPEQYDLVTLGRIKTRSEQGIKIAGKEAIYDTGGIALAVDKKFDFHIPITRDDAETSVFSSDLDDFLEHWDDGNIPWKDYLTMIPA
jgi:hypothetical protein